MGKKLSPGANQCHSGARARPASREPRNTVSAELWSRLVFMVSGPALRASRNDSESKGMKPRCWFSVIGLMLSLLAAGCADPGAASDNDKRGVFYGGVSAGGTRP